MDASVRYVVHSNDIGVKPALCFRGTKYAHCLLNDDDGIRVGRVELREFDKAEVVLYQGSAYPIKLAAERLIAFTKRETARKSITQGALDLINRILEGNVTEEKIEPKPTLVKVIEESSKASVLGSICAELKIDPSKARAMLRKAGLSAPYHDAAAIRKVLEK